MMNKLGLIKNIDGLLVYYTSDSLMCLQIDKSLLNELDITTDKFKQYIKTRVSMSNIILKNHSYLYKINYQFKFINNHEIQNLADHIFENLHVNNYYFIQFNGELPQ